MRSNLLYFDLINYRTLFAQRHCGAYILMVDSYEYDIDYQIETDNLGNYYPANSNTNKRLMLLCALLGCMTSAMLLAGWGLHIGLKESRIIRSERSLQRSMLVGINADYGDYVNNKLNYPDSEDRVTPVYINILSQAQINTYFYEVLSQIEAIRSMDDEIYRQVHDEFMLQVNSLANNYQPEIEYVTDQILELTLKAKLISAENTAIQYENDLFLQNAIHKSKHILTNIKNNSEYWYDTESNTNVRAISELNSQHLVDINHTISNQEKTLDISADTLRNQIIETKQKLIRLTTQRDEALCLLRAEYLDKLESYKTRIMLTQGSNINEPILSE